MKIDKSLLIILALVGGSVAIAVILYILRPQAEKTEPARPVPLLEVVKVLPETVDLWLPSQGTVEPRTQTMLGAEVFGKVVRVSDSFVSGGYFEGGDVLLEIESADYKAALARAKAQLAEARLALAQEEASVEQAQQDWERFGEGQASALTLREPQLERARAQVESALASVSMAELNLERTQVRAPYSGRVVETFVDVGQYVGAVGVQLARIYANDKLEVSLSLEAKDDALIGEITEEAIPVKLSSRVGYETHFWQGFLERREAVVNERSRLRYVVASIGKEAQQGNSLLLPGMFVQARIKGHTLEGVYVLPRAALIDRETVLTVDKEVADDKSVDVLRRRKVRVLYADETRAFIDQGLDARMRVVVTPLEYIIEGMEVEVLEVSLEEAIRDDSELITDGEQVFGRKLEGDAP